MANKATPTSLTNTLVLALTQCQDQVRDLEENARTITRLQRENEKLRKELEEARAAAKRGDGIDAHRAELESLYQSDFDKQALIDKLRQKLKIVKIKARQHGLVDTITSSPLPSSGTARQPAKATPVTSPPRTLLDKTPPPEAGLLPSLAKPIPEKSLLSLYQKRARSRSPVAREPLREVSGNAKTSNNNRKEDAPAPKRQRRSGRVLAAGMLAEDGEDHLTEVQEGKTEHKAKETHISAYERLHDLMSAPTPTRPSLLQPRPSSASPKTAKAKEIDFNMSRSTSPRPKASNRSTRKSMPRYSITKSAPVIGPEDDEPFRSRPLSKLDLSHFKLNPAVNGGLQYAYREVVRGRQERKCLPGCTKLECCGGKFSVLAATLPSMPGMQGMSDEELLMGYLGPNSEEKIRSLTPVARTNLLHEARTKLVANMYGKMHRDIHDRSKSPPGYWSTDMPGSQEHEQFREQARLLEREETRQRYQEAKKDGGRWIFADE